MKYTTMQDFRNALVAYLKSEKAYCEADIKANHELSDDEKEENGLIVRHAHVVRRDGVEYELSVTINNTKLRPGDSVQLRNMSRGGLFTAKIIENGFYRITLACPQELSLADEYRLEILEIVLLDPMIKLLSGIEEGVPGSTYLATLAGIQPAVAQGIGAIRFEQVEELLPDTFNVQQIEAYRHAIQRPSVYCIQGPPGTGKTDVLSRIAAAYCDRKKSILVLANTHQAVNNALNKIARNAAATIVKVGESLKAEDLTDEIIRCRTYAEYARQRKEARRGTDSEVIGMTVHGCVMNLALKKNDFCPSVILVDEAGQLPLSLAACIGAVGCGSVIFIGDDKQMPPIYHPRLVENPLSVSAFTYITQLYPDLKTRLCTTYRMNELITEVVSRCFYEADGEPLVSSQLSRDRRHTLSAANSGDSTIDTLLRSPQSILRWNPSTLDDCEDYNVEEATFIARLISEAYRQGMTERDLAVITPYRRQVRTIRECVRDVLSEDQELPLIDTVERLQGQDVDLIIISFCVTSPLYFQSNRAFLFNPNRLNVMISRAKKKVIIIGSHLIQTQLTLQTAIKEESLQQPEPRSFQKTIEIQNLSDDKKPIAVSVPQEIEDRKIEVHIHVDSVDNMKVDKHSSISVDCQEFSPQIENSCVVSFGKNEKRQKRK